MDGRSGLEEYQEALAPANADRGATSTPVPPRVRGIAIGLLGLIALALGLGVILYDQYRQANDLPASGTIVEVHRRSVIVAFTSAEGTPLLGDMQQHAREPAPRVGDRQDILYLPGVHADGMVSAFDPTAPASDPAFWFVTALGVVILAVGALEFSGRAPWKNVVWLDERSIGAPRPADRV
ncbi:hypothetical protein [Herbidospora cretacea]|uniref:hypothetical protein n=1 Tax=Herbidospora cretacea TaxID=28444 RepID=UPI000774BDFB|nr:hypothetical protein [Herbidospora cretacea]